MPLRKILLSKIHRLTITEANVNYEGSITIDAELLHAAEMLPGEAVCVWNVTTGARFETYIIEGEAGSGTAALNGAAARKATPGDIVIVAAFSMMTPEEARVHRPKAVFVDGDNAVKEVREERPQKPRRQD